MSHKVKIRGTKLDDVNLSGTIRADDIKGKDGNDIIFGDLGDDKIDGGKGIDTAVLNGVFLSYDIRYLGNQKNGNILVSGADGSDSYKNVEFLRFDNGVFDVGAGVFTADFPLAAFNAAAADSVAALAQVISEAASFFGSSFTDYTSLVAGRQTALLQDLIDNRPTNGYATSGEAIGLFGDLVEFRTSVQAVVDNANEELQPLTLELFNDVRDALVPLDGKSLSGEVLSLATVDAALKRFEDLPDEYQDGILKTVDGGNYGSFSQVVAAFAPFFPGSGEAVRLRLENDGTVTVLKSTLANLVADDANGDVILVGPGTFAGSFTLDKAVTVLGANAGIAGDATTRGTESKIQGTFIVDSDSVTVDGLHFDGGASAIRGVGVKAYDTLTIRNNLIENTTDSAIRFGFGSGGGIGSDNWVITDNKISDIKGSNLTGMVLFNVTDLTVTGNVIEHDILTLDDKSVTGRRGINLDGIQDGTITGNTLDFGAITGTSWGIQVSMSNREASDLIINGNTVSNVASGIIGLSQRSINDIDIINNTVTGVANGIVLNTGGDLPQSSGVTMKDVDVLNNTISATNFAILLRDSHNSALNGNGPILFETASVSGNTISNGIVSVGRLNPPGVNEGSLLNIAGTVTAEGGTGNDVFAIEGTGALVAKGGLGADEFRFAAGSSNVNDPDTILDLNLGTNALAGQVDKLTFQNNTAATVYTLTGSERAFVKNRSDLGQAADAVAAIAGSDGQTVMFTHGGQAYIFHNVDGNTSFNAAADILVKVTGVTGTLDASDIGTF